MTLVKPVLQICAQEPLAGPSWILPDSQDEPLPSFLGRIRV